jgi:hypothetical protein
MQKNVQQFQFFKLLYIGKCIVGYLLFFSSHFGHRKVLDRVQSAVAAGLEVNLICYDRLSVGDSRDELVKLCKSINIIGNPRDGGNLFRIVYWFNAFAKYLLVLRNNGLPAAVLANNGEFLIFSSFLYFGSAKKFFDFADVHPIQYKLGLKSKLYRFLERLALYRNWKIIVTSPWFYWNYFLDIQNSPSEVRLIENKLSEQEFTSLELISPRNPSRNGPINIGWTGILRCSTSLKLLVDLCQKYPGKYNVFLIGIIGNINSEIVDEARRCPFIYFKGKYLESNLGRMLDEVDYVWAADFDDGLNSKLLLPNRLYQAIAGKRPVIAFSDSATGKVTAHFGIGPRFDIASAAELNDRISLVDERLYLAYCEAEVNLRERMVRKNEFIDLFTMNNLVENNLPPIEDFNFVLVV